MEAYQDNYPPLVRDIKLLYEVCLNSYRKLFVCLVLFEN